jgi:hypothetical protein
MINGESRSFQVLAYIAFALVPITRSERIETRRRDIFSRDEAQETQPTVRTQCNQCAVSAGNKNS